MDGLTYMNHTPLVTIIIPCLQEQKHIEAVLESIVAQDYPRERLEVLVVDGMSEDNTRRTVGEFSLRYPFVRLLDNPKRTAPAALNIGIQNTQGEIVVRMDAHTTYETDYVTGCVKALSENDADVVGGTLKVVTETDSFLGRAIALALANRFGVGNAHHKAGHITEQMNVDTVPFGCYPKLLFDRIGTFDEDVPQCEDADFHRRVRAAGGKILLVPSIVSYYRARSTLTSFWNHNLHNGFRVTYYLKFGKVAFFGRHLVPPAFVSAILGSAALSLVYPLFFWLFLAVVGSFSLASVVASFRVAVAQRDPRVGAAMPIAFTLLHWSYGLGSVWGLVRALTSASLWRRVLVRRSSLDRQCQ